MENYNVFGAMVDMSRNAVMTVEAVKRFIDDLEKMGYNMLMLYTEDTYEVDGEPYFGYMRGRYTKEEMRELDAYGEAHGVELIPCMQTLAHLNAYIRWDKTPVDIADILLVGDDKTYDLIDRMFKTLSECFKTRRIHIGMDEAWMLGRGKYIDKNGGYEHAHSIIRKHLTRVVEIAKRYDYEVIMWSDMYFFPWTDGKYYIPKCEMPKEYVDALLPGVIPVYWDYYHKTEDNYDNMMYNHRQLSKDFWFAGAVWTGNGYMPHHKDSIETMLPALRMAEKYEVKNVFMTMWGDGGGECSRFALLPSLYHLAQAARGNTDEKKIKEGFYEMFGAYYDDFVLLDLPDSLCGSGQGVHPFSNVSKYAILSDTFNGWLDYTIEKGVAHRFENAAKKLRAAERRNPKYAAIFHTAACLASLLAVKYDLGLRVREAYQSNDREALTRIAKVDYPKASRRLCAFIAAVEAQWLAENKPAGLDVQHIRLGAVKERLDYCRRTLVSYLNGDVASIPELCEEILPFYAKERSFKTSKTMEIMTPSVFL